MRYSDIPILRPNEDALRRARFALTLASAIDSLAIAKDGFVMSIVGEWGAGKSSVVSLMRRYLLHIEMARASNNPLASHLNSSPRSVDELEQMAQVFERVEDKTVEIEANSKNGSYWEISNCLSCFKDWLGSDDDAAAAAYYWRLRLHVRSNPRTIVLPFSPWQIAGHAQLATALLSEISRSLGNRVDPEISLAFGRLLTRLGEFAPVAGAGLDLATGGIGGSLLRASGDWSKKLGDRLARGPTLDDVRHTLTRVLQRMGETRILVIIDDLDRLTPLEAIQMISLIKSLGSLPNIIYLLSYDEANLAELVSRAIGLDGRTYLEKIVQYQVSLPHFDSVDLTRMMNRDVGTLLGELLEDDQTRLSDAWYLVLRHYLRTPRDVKRLANCIAVAQPTIGDHTDPIDLIVMEALRLFEPQVYRFVRDNIEVLVD
jgi:hypothetical protein